MHQHIKAQTPVKPFRFVAVSYNRKTGPIPVTSTAAQSCPIACPMHGDNAGGCYAASGNSALHWRQLTEGKASTAIDAETLFSKIKGLPKGQLWRMNEAGDLPHNQQVIDAEFLQSIGEANKGKQGFTYTHHNLSIPGNAAAVSAANAAGFTVNISTNSLQHADTVRAEFPGLPMVTLVDSAQWQGKNTVRTPAGHTVVRCPAEYIDGVTCNTCKLCAVNTRKGIVGFTPHGTGKARVIKIIAAASNAE